MSTIDIVIPAIEKDMGTLPHAIDGIRKYVQHPIGSIYMVSPASERLRKLCVRKGCVFVDEREVLPITKKDIHYRSNNWDRSGWLYQQLLKFGSSKMVRHRHYLTMDADTVLIRPHSFLIGEKTVFYTRNWSQPEYARTYEKLMGRPPSAPASFVAHYMLFDKHKLAKLKKEIEAKHGTPWYYAIMRSMNKAKPFAFSEFETYGNFLYQRDPGLIIRKPTQNRSLAGNYGSLRAGTVQKLARRFRSLSFHKRKIYLRPISIAARTMRKNHDSGKSLRKGISTGAGKPTG